MTVTTCMQVLNLLLFNEKTYLKLNCSVKSLIYSISIDLFLPGPLVCPSGPRVASGTSSEISFPAPVVYYRPWTSADDVTFTYENQNTTAEEIQSFPDPAIRDQNHTLMNLPFGTNVIRVTATDQYYNIATCNFTYVRIGN